MNVSDLHPEIKWSVNKNFIQQIIYYQYLSKHDEPKEIDYYLCRPSMINSAINKIIYNFGDSTDNFGG